MYIMNYNFYLDKNAIDPSATYIPSTNSLQLTNAIYDHLTLTNNGEEQYSTIPPAEWDNTTVLDADFDGNVNAGNISYSTEDLAGIRVKRRIKGTFTWLTLYDMPTTHIEDLTFTKYDILNQHGQEYEYALVPYLNDGSECAYIIKEIESTLNGVFVCSSNAIAKFYGDIGYDSGELVNLVGVFEPLGSKYPVVVSNAVTQYYKGSLTGIAMSFNQLMNDTFNRVDISRYAKILMEFLADKKTKVIKDWNGNIWIVAITSNPTLTYNNKVGMGVGDINFNFVEIADFSSDKALVENGLINPTFSPVTNPIPSFSPRQQGVVNNALVGS